MSLLGWQHFQQEFHAIHVCNLSRENYFQIVKICNYKQKIFVKWKLLLMLPQCIQLVKCFPNRNFYDKFIFVCMYEWINIYTLIFLCLSLKLVVYIVSMVFTNEDVLFQKPKVCGFCLVGMLLQLLRTNDCSVPLKRRFSEHTHTDFSLKKREILNKGI